MPIPKTIYQTFRNNDLPLVTRWHINRLRRRNPDYDYQFYDDKRISKFIADAFGKEVYALYSKLTIGAAKADFFRYAVLYKYGGVYLDIDSLCLTKLNDFILPTDVAIISLEDNKKSFVQWALIFEAGHPFLKKTLDVVLQNIAENKHVNDVHQMTGPTAYTSSIRACMEVAPNVNYRQVGIDYDGKFKFHYRFSKLFLYGFFRKNHWKKQQRQNAALLKR